LIQPAADAEPKKEERPKSPNLISKILANFKSDKDKPKPEKKKTPKSPKKDKKKEEPVCSFISPSISSLNLPFLQAAPAAEPTKEPEAATEAPAEPAAEPTKTEDSPAEPAKEA